MVAGSGATFFDEGRPDATQLGSYKFGLAETTFAHAILRQNGILRWIAVPLQTLAHARFRYEQLRLARFRFELPHQRPQVWHVVRRFVAPDVQDQLAVGDHQPEVRGQELQQPVLLARQRDVPAVRRYLARNEIDRALPFEILQCGIPVLSDSYGIVCIARCSSSAGAERDGSVFTRQPPAGRGAIPPTTSVDAREKRLLADHLLTRMARAFCVGDWTSTARSAIVPT
jgi:hypothetical protein